MADKNENPEINVPDDLSSLVTPRFYRKEAQTSLVKALEASRGKSGMTDAEKLAALKSMQENLAAALGSVSHAIALMETGEVPE